jgi:hypothetical protein
MLRGEATNTNFIVFGLTWPGLEPTIYNTRGEHANHYTTDAVYFSYIMAVSFIGGGNQSTQRKPPTCR